MLTLPAGEIGAIHLRGPAELPRHHRMEVAAQLERANHSSARARRVAARIAVRRSVRIIIAFRAP